MNKKRRPQNRKEAMDCRNADRYDISLTNILQAK
jgi:hypothetical protein